MVGNFVRALAAPALYNEWVFRCTVAGTSASTEPNWSLGAPNNNNTLTDGGVTWQNVTGQSAYNWSAPAGTLYTLTYTNITGRVLAGDRCFLSSDHSETLTGANTIAMNNNSNAFGVSQFISVNRAGSVPPAPGDALSGAAIITSAGQFNFDPWCSAYWQGITFNAASTIDFAVNARRSHYFRNCAFILSRSGNADTLSVNAITTKVTFDNTTVQFSNTGQGFSLVNSSNAIDFQWINTPSAISGTVPTNLFLVSSNTQSMATLRGVDLSALTTALMAPNTSWNKLLLDSCRIAPGLSRALSPSATQTAADEIELVNCFDGTNILSERHTAAGDITTNRSTTLVGGAQDDVGLFSHQMVSSTRSDFLAVTLDSFWMDVENTYTGSTRTATVEIVSSASLNNTDISLVLEYQGTSGSSLATLTSTLPSALTTSAALPTSTATWNSPPSTPVYQHLQATFTPQQAGRVRGVVRLGKPSTTVYVNPQIIVT